MSVKEFNSIVLGGGPAGLTAGIYMARAKQKVVIIDEGTVGGQVILSHAVANYPGVDEVPGYSLANAMKKQAKQFGCVIRSNAEVREMDLKDDPKRVIMEDGTAYEAEAVILAMGGSPRTLGLESENSFKGNGISYCATCDGDFFQDQDIVVVGGGNSALEEAVSLTTYAKSVTVIHQFDQFQAYPYAVEEAQSNGKIRFALETVVDEFLGNGSLEKVVVKNVKTGERSTLDARGAFIFIGYVPNTVKFRDILDLNEKGEIETDEDMRTDIPGVFAAGDTRKKKVRQITTAVADGTIAALSAIDYINSKKH